MLLFFPVVPVSLVGFVAAGALSAAALHWRRAKRADGSRRVRTGRLPLPRRVIDLSPADEPALESVNAFVDRLAEMPVARWLEIGYARMADASGLSRHATSFAILEATINVERLGVAAWYVRDAVETSAHLAGAAVVRWTSSDRRAFAAAHAAAEDAALALLARDQLPRADCAVLYAPFARVDKVHKTLLPFAG